MGSSLCSSPSLSYRLGLAVLRGVAVDAAPPWLVYDPRLDALVAPGHRFSELRAWAADQGVPDEGSAAGDFDAPLLDPREPRPYQTDAVNRWRASGARGTVVLPTGAGKTLVALLAIDALRVGACIVAPTRALVAQWFTQLADAFGVERVGAYYGDEKEARALTVTTYHSAFPLLERWGARFPLLVLDEVHHLADSSEGEATAWHDHLRIAPSPYRLGLTATYPDGRDAELRRLVGPVAYRRTIGEMTDAELARYAIVRRYVRLTPGEDARYQALTDIYERHLANAGYRDRATAPADAWRMFAASARRSPAARRALRAFHERERVVRLAAGKLREAERILRAHPAEQAVLFCGGTDAAEAVSRELAIPMITASTPASERHALLGALDRGDVRAVASVRVLDEGWDLPGAKLGIVLGDSTRGSGRQHVQRLGRLLRRQGDAVASLYEIVAAGTYEFFASQKRGAGVRRVSERQLGFGM
ncbi:MAG TPA: DEAD/DEAH box helicase [Gemmatimonadaceae bacterium]|jgi:superfamily II DNA or RNA helicase|nr:DEAD/DEAH box helicase [Gemmatimonadaceae bacterium]